MLELTVGASGEPSRAAAEEGGMLEIAEPTLLLV